MAKVNNKTKGFNSITRDVVFDESISYQARFIYVYMACKSKDWEFFQDVMAKEIGIGKDTLRKYLDELIASGWITEEKQQHIEKGKFGALQYTIEIEKKRNGKNPIRKNTDSEKYRNGKNPNHKDIDNNRNIDNEEIDKEKSISNDIPKKESKRSRFVKPTIEQIEAYIREKNLHFGAEQFFDYYESKGWMVGSNHMKNWKAACRTWEHKRKKENNTPVQSEPEIPAADVEPWEKVQRWIKENTPTFADKVRYKDFTAMRGYAMFNAKTFADILIKMYESGYEGDIVSEFKRLFDEV